MLVVRKMGEDLQKTGNAVLLDTYAQKTSQRLGVGVESVRTEFRKARSAPPRHEPDEPPLTEPDEGATAVEPIAPPPKHELWLLKYLLASADLAHFAAAHLEPAWVTHPTVRRIAALHFSMGTDVAGLLAQFEGDDFAGRLITENASEQRAIPEPEKQLADVILRLRSTAYDQRIAQLNAYLSDTALSDEERAIALTEQQQLRVAKRQPLHPLGEE